ncbi:hypothetical protein GGR50DRAFT_235797 [Xylaria sp. CBS 124048]|nr:hypothetical protein GGR50DRAFT_235797 [Xylaria sp. CBS 124048]
MTTNGIRPAEVPEHLIVVGCHGIWAGGPSKGFDEGEWLLASFQTGEVPTMIEHIKTGLRALADDPRAVLMFSGGPTRRETRLSESSSYANVAAANSYFQIISEDAASTRILKEERALDSYFNVLFSIVKFWSTYGIWPTKLTSISHGFKRERIVDCHCAAMRYPLDCVTFIGVDPPGMLDGSNKAAIPGVQEAVDQWNEDPHGMGDILAPKRKRRNPWGVPQTLFSTEEERVRSGVRSRVEEDGQEFLIDGVPQPWSGESVQGAK